MATTFQSTSPNINRRVGISSTIVITFSASLDQNTVNEGNILFTDANSVPIPFSVSGVTDSISINPDSDLSYNTVYIITLTNQVLDTLSDPVEDANGPSPEIKFITEELSITPIINVASDGNVNDLIFKKNLIMDLFDGREIIESGNKFNFEMVPQKYDSTLKVYSNATTTKITFDNQTLFLDKIRKQELSTFDEFLENIKELSGLSASGIEEIKKTLLIKSFDINSSSGLIRKIEYLTEIFANAFGLFFVDVEPDPFKPFVYYISTTLPKIHWSSTLREMVHPTGWSDNYIEIDQTLTFQKDATTATYWNYFQTEQYEWEDNYILGSDDFSLEFKGIRQGFAIHGQGLGLYIPVTDSSGTPPSSYIPTALGGSQNLESNYANTVHVKEGTGSVVGGTSVLTTNTDLSKFTIDLWAPLSGAETSDFYLTIAEGNNVGFYEILTNTANTTGNTITIEGTFSETEVGLTFWVVDKEGTTQRELLAVLNNLRTKPKFVFSYLQASQLGKIDSNSRLVFDADNDLQLIIVPGSTITSFTDTPSDTTFLYDNEAAPVLWVQSSTDFQDQDAMSFGNTVLQNTVINFPLIDDGRFYDIASMSAGDANDIQTVTFVGEIDGSVSSLGPPGLEAGNTLIITDMDNGGNNNTFIILTHDYTAKIVTIFNENAINEPTPSGSPKAEQQILAHNLVISFIHKSAFSNDAQLFTGYAVFFNQCVIDAIDKNSMDQFDFQYAEWDAPINYPKIGTGNSDYDDFVGTNSLLGSLNFEGDTYAESNFDTMSSSGIFKKYYTSGLNVSWEIGNKIYEITRIDASSDLAVDPLGTYFGRIERAELTYSTWAADKSYLKGDRVIGTGGAVNWIFEAKSSDVSDDTEPLWDLTAGQTTNPSGETLEWLTIDQLNVVVRFMGTLVNEVWVDDSGTFTDYTKEANDQTQNSNLSGDTFYTDDVPLLPGSPGATVNDALYIGNSTPFSHFIIDISTLGVGTYTITWEYWDSDSWEPLTVGTDNIANFKPSSTGKYDLVYTTPTDWAATTIAATGSASLYWIRGRLSAFTDLTTQPLAKQIFINSDFNTGTDIFYGLNETENEFLTTASDGQIVDSYTEFGTYISQMDRKITLQHSIPDCDEYIWAATDVTPGIDTQIEYVKNIPDIMSNKYILFGKEGINYDVNLTINLFEREVTEILTLADGSGSELDGTYFTLESGTGVNYYVWFDTGVSANDPTPSGFTELQVIINSGDTADSVALKMSVAIAAINNATEFTAVVDDVITNKVTVENIILGDATNTIDGTLSGLETGFTFTTIFQGRSNVEDIFDYLGL